MFMYNSTFNIPVTACHFIVAWLLLMPGVQLVYETKCPRVCLLLPNDVKHPYKSGSWLSHSPGHSHYAREMASNEITLLSFKELLQQTLYIIRLE